MGEGWVKLHRSIIDWEWYSDQNTTRLFLHLLITANHEPKKWRGKVIGRGQILTSRAKLSEQTGLSERQIRTSIKRLKSTNEVTSESTKKETVLTVCNYDTYQSRSTASDQQNDQPSDQQTTNRRPSNEQEGKELKEEKKERKRHTVDLSTDSMILEIYEAYPKKVGKPDALRKIKAALKTTPPEELLKLTQQYGQAVKGIVEKQFIPNPSTWFNQQRYSDDPETWVNGQNQPKDRILSKPANVVKFFG